jgi:hypothetical protein
MFLQLLLVALTYRIGDAYAHPIQVVSLRGYVRRSTNQSQSLSVEAIVGVIAVVVAIFGIALPFIWPRLRSRLDSRRRSRSRPSSTGASYFNPLSKLFEILTEASKFRHPACQRPEAECHNLHLGRPPSFRRRWRDWYKPTTTRAIR